MAGIQRLKRAVPATANEPLDVWRLLILRGRFIRTPPVRPCIDLREPDGGTFNGTHEVRELRVGHLAAYPPQPLDQLCPKPLSSLVSHLDHLYRRPRHQRCKLVCQPCGESLGIR